MKKLKIFLFFTLFFSVMTNTYAILDVNTSFSPTTIYPTQISTHTIKVQNSTTQVATDAHFEYELPENILIADTPNIESTCGNAIQTENTNNHGKVTLTNGTIPAGTAEVPGSCEIRFDVYASTPGNYDIIFANNTLTATKGGKADNNPQDTKATLSVNPLQNFDVYVKYTNDFNNDTRRIYSSAQIKRTMTFTNPNPIPLTNITIPKTKLFRQYIHAIDGTFATTCGGNIAFEDIPETSTYLTGTYYSYSGGTIPANGSCEISFGVENSYKYSASSYYSEHIQGDSMQSTQGVSNNSGKHNVYRYLGILTNQSFSPNILEKEEDAESRDTTLTMTFENQDVKDHTWNYTHTLPSNTDNGGKMTFKEVQVNTCGGEITGSDQTINFSNLTFPKYDGGYHPCTVKFLISIDKPGKYTSEIASQKISNTNSFALGSSSASVGVLNIPTLGVNKSYSRENIHTGDTTTLTYTLTNNTKGDKAKTLKEISLRDILTERENAYCRQADNKCFRVHDIVTSTCEGININAPLDSNDLRFSGITLTSGESCTISVPVISTGNIPSNPNSYINNIYYNSYNYVDDIAAGDIKFKVEGEDTIRTNPEVLEDIKFIRLNGTIRLDRLFEDTIVSSNGIARLYIRLIYRSNDRNTATIDYTTKLPEGFTIADHPNIENNCEGEVMATPGADRISLANYKITPPSDSDFLKACLVYFDAKAPTVTVEKSVWFNGEDHITATHNGDVAPYNEYKWFNRDDYTITIRPQYLTSNKEFLTTNIKSGAPARVRVTLANILDENFDISEGTVTEDYSTGNLRLHTDANPTFVSSDGDENKCKEATFDIEGNVLKMSGAKIKAGATCYLEYNVTSIIGGNHFTEFKVNQFASREGVTNKNNSSTTLTVERNINIGETFEPKTAESGEEVDLMMEVFNAQIAPADETGTTFINELPSGLTAKSITSNTCGGEATITTQNGNSAIKLVGGTFPAENTCKLTVKVSSDTVGEYRDTIAVGDLQTVAGKLNPSPSETTLKVIQKPTISQSVSKSKIPLDGTSNIVVSITNPNSNTDIHKVNFTNNLPAGLQLTNGSASTSGACIGTPKYTAVSGADTFTLDEIGVSAGGTCRITYSVTGKNSGEKTNTIQSVSYQESKNTFGPSNTATIKVLQPLTLTTSFSPSTIYLKDTSKLTYTIINPNDESIDLESIKNILPATPGVMKVAETTNLEITGCSTNPRVLSSIDDTDLKANDTSLKIINGIVPANGICTVSFNIKVTKAGTYTNETKKIISSGGESEKATAILTIDDTPLANLVTKKSVSNSNPKEGEEIVYTISVENKGPLDATNVTLTDILPEGVEYISDNTVKVKTENENKSSQETEESSENTNSISSNKEALASENSAETEGITEESSTTESSTETTESQSTNQKGNYDKNTGVWNIGDIANGETKTLEIRVKVKSGTVNTSIINTTTPASTPDQVDTTTDGDILEASIGVNYFDTNLVTKKSVNIKNPRETDQIIYTIFVENKGPNKATNVTLTDLLPEGVEYISDNGNGSYNTTSGVWNIGELNSSEDKTLEIKVKIKPQTVGTTIINITTKAVGYINNQIDPTDEGNILSADIIVTNKAPEITSDGGGEEVNISIPENTNIVTTLKANDLEDDNSTLKFSISGGEDANLFIIDSNTNELKYIGEFDFENPQDINKDNIYKVEVTVTDSFDTTNIQKIIISISDIIEGRAPGKVTIDDDSRVKGNNNSDEDKGNEDKKEKEKEEVKGNEKETTSTGKTEEEVIKDNDKKQTNEEEIPKLNSAPEKEKKKESEIMKEYFKKLALSEKENGINKIEVIKGEDEFKELPKILPKTGAIDTKAIYKRGGLAGAAFRTLVDIRLPSKKTFRLAGSDNKDLSYWLQVVPEQDRNKNKYIVIPSKGLVMPINTVSRQDKEYNSFINGNNEDFYDYLRDGSVELPGTSTRGYGEVGNKVIGGHSSYWYSGNSRYKTHFQKIIELNSDEYIWIYEKDKNTGEFKRYVYKVFSSYNTGKDDASILKATNNKQLTLFTCTPIGGVHGRWIVKAEFIAN